MAAIIGLHMLSYLLQGFHASAHSSLIEEPALYLGQLMKFGTIAFFLVSGFLMGERIDQCSSRQYFLRRLRNVFIPWCLWYILGCVLKIAASLPPNGAGGLTLAYCLSVCEDVALNTAFWFVPNLLIALAIVLVCRRFLNDVRLGLIFLMASLFYGANIYGDWIAVEHTKAVFGFVFFLWLGAWSASHFAAIEKILARIPTSAMLALVIMTLGLAIAESKFLQAYGSIQPLNTLRVSNQIYSVVAALAIIKVRCPVWPSIVNVREHTFGLYLTHTAMLAMFSRAMKPILGRLSAGPTWAVIAGCIVAASVLYALTYGSCLALVRALLAHPRLRWTVGLPQKRAPRKLDRYDASKPADREKQLPKRGGAFCGQANGYR